MRWNLVVFGVGIIVLNAMVMAFLWNRELGEPAWLLLGVVVGGFVTYASNIAQALTGPASPAPTVTETHAKDLAEIVRDAGAGK